MTNKEAIETLNLHNPFISNNTMLSEAMDMAVKSLENSNSVAINTLEELLKEINDMNISDNCYHNIFRLVCVEDVFEKIYEHIKELKEGKNNRVIGHWIRQKGIYGLVDTCECSVCGRTIYAKTEDDLKDYPYCHCGARMEGKTE